MLGNLSTIPQYDGHIIRGNVMNNGKKKDKMSISDQPNVTINFNTFSFNANNEEDLAKITAKILEELPQVKETYDAEDKRDSDGVLADKFITDAYKRWKEDLVQASTVVMKILSKNPNYSSLIGEQDVLCVMITSDSIKFRV